MSNNHDEHYREVYQSYNKPKLIECVLKLQRMHNNNILQRRMLQFTISTLLERIESGEKIDVENIREMIKNKWEWIK